MKRQIIVVALSLIAMLTVAAAPAFAGGLTLIETPSNAAVYTVQPGDTLLLIARHFGVDLYTLAYVNGIANVNHIYTGQVLNIAAARGTVTYPVNNAPANASTYTVQHGDNLFRIALHFGVDMYTLAAVNGIANVSHITSGQVLNIAAARPQVPPSFPVYGAPVNASSYTVQRGDNLFRIALHFGVNLNTLAYVNGITDTRRIHAGQVLNIAAARF